MLAGAAQDLQHASAQGGTDGGVRQCGVRYGDLLLRAGHAHVGAALQPFHLQCRQLQLLLKVFNFPLALRDVLRRYVILRLAGVQVFQALPGVTQSILEVLLFLLFHAHAAVPFQFGLREGEFGLLKLQLPHVAAAQNRQDIAGLDLLPFVREDFCNGVCRRRADVDGSPVGQDAAKTGNVCGAGCRCRQAGQARNQQ